VGGGLRLVNNPSLYLRSDTIVSNTAGAVGGGVALYLIDQPIANTIIAGNQAPFGPDLIGAFHLRYDLVRTTISATITDEGGNLFGLDPPLGPLANHGGPTQTHFPAGTGRVVNAGDPAFAPPPTIDQRGHPRVLAGRVDIGAVETWESFLPAVRR